jgi:hypothetical protein
MTIRTRVAIAAAAAAVALTATVGQAHHSIANFWDATKTISVTGVVKTVKLVNPHSEITLEETVDGKPVKWTAFGLGITDLRRRGITSEMLLNKKVTLTGNPPKQAAGKGVFISLITFEDGKQLNIREAGAFRGTPSADNP